MDLKELTFADIEIYLRKYRVSENSIQKLKDENIDGIFLSLLGESDIPSLVTGISDQIKIKCIIKQLTNLGQKEENEVKSNIKVETKSRILNRDDMIDSDSSQAATIILEDDHPEIGIKVELNEDFDDELDDTSEESNDCVSQKAEPSIKIEFPAPLPIFSNKIENSLQVGNCWAEDKTRNQLMNELAVFYRSNNYRLMKSQDYKYIAMTLLMKYEDFKKEIGDIADSINGKISKTNENCVNPWRLIARLLSRKIRNLRAEETRKKKEALLLEEKFKKHFQNAVVMENVNKKDILNVKMEQCCLLTPPLKRKNENENERINQLATPSRRRKLLTGLAESTPIESEKLQPDLSTESTDKNKKNEIFEQLIHEKLKILFKKQKNKEEMPMLVEKTFEYRRKCICNSNNVFTELLNDYSYLTDIENLEIEFCLMLKSKISDIKNKIKNILLIVWKNYDFKSADELTGFTKSLLQMEKQTKISKTESILIVENSNDDALTKNDIQCPRIYLKNNSFQIVSLATPVIKEIQNFVDAMVYLFAMYFVFDVKYPDCFKQVLGIFHEFVFPNFKNVTSTRTINYINLYALIASKFK